MVERPGFGSQQGRNFIFSATSRKALRPSQFPVKLIPGFIPRRSSGRDREDNYSLSLSAEVMSTLHPLSMHFQDKVFN